MMRTEQEIYQAAIDTFGYDAQVDILIEEMSELTQALLKSRRNCFSSDIKYLSNLHEEFADVKIVMAQVETTLNKKMLAHWHDLKLTRLENLINQHTDGKR